MAEEDLEQAESISLFKDAKRYRWSLKIYSKRINEEDFKRLKKLNDRMLNDWDREE